MRGLRILAIGAAFLSGPALAQTEGVEDVMALGFEIADITSNAEGDAVITLEKNGVFAECVVDLDTDAEACRLLESASTDGAARPGAGESLAEEDGFPTEPSAEAKQAVVDFLKENGCALPRGPETAELAETYFAGRGIAHDESSVAAERLVEEGVITVVGGVITLAEGCE